MVRVHSQHKRTVQEEHYLLQRVFITVLTCAQKKRNGVQIKPEFSLNELNTAGVKAP